MSRALKLHLNKEELSKVFALYSRQPWIMQREKFFIELLKLCKTSENKSLIIKLLSEFHFLNVEIQKNYLEAMVDFIVSDTGFIEETTQIAALTYDSSADSSQSVLQAIKVPLYQQGWSKVKTVNKFGDIIKNYGKQNKKQIVCVDEFVGSGSTVVGRVNWLQKNIGGEFELKFCFIAGMDHGLRVIEELGYEVFCPLRLPRGISESFSEPEREEAIKNMKKLETKLAENINEYELIQYMFGYNKAEALYSSEGLSGNTPNSVFPIFWWPRLKNNKKRNTLLTRVESGLK